MPNHPIVLIVTFYLRLFWISLRLTLPFFQTAFERLTDYLKAAKYAELIGLLDGQCCCCNFKVREKTNFKIATSCYIVLCFFTFSVTPVPSYFLLSEEREGKKKNALEWRQVSGAVVIKSELSYLFSLKSLHRHPNPFLQPTLNQSVVKM